VLFFCWQVPYRTSLTQLGHRGYPIDPLRACGNLLQ